MRCTTPFRLGLIAFFLLVLPAEAGDREAIQSTIEEAYFEGAHQQRDGALMRTGFHEGFTMYFVRNGQLEVVSLDDWIEHLETWKAEQPERPFETTARIAQLDITGHAATAKVEIERDGKLTFTDYLSLYRFPEGWRIVAKTFVGHR